MSATFTVTVPWWAYAVLTVAVLGFAAACYWCGFLHGRDARRDAVLRRRFAPMLARWSQPPIPPSPGVVSRLLVSVAALADVLSPRRPAPAAPVEPAPADDAAEAVDRIFSQVAGPTWVAQRAEVPSSPSWDDINRKRAELVEQADDPERTGWIPTGVTK
ncbi:hypothetical protein ABZ949_02695 [Micromonospora tulbaghiae]|uniref:hypothetical protein n=1 Tax=Micromonospora tulbaghiae TaxID=479978 RepID=UPI0033FA4EA1